MGQVGFGINSKGSIEKRKKIIKGIIHIFIFFSYNYYSYIIKNVPFFGCPCMAMRKEG